MFEDGTIPVPNHDISHSRYILASWKRDISSEDAYRIVELNNRLGRMFSTEYRLDRDGELGGCIINSWLLNALPVREDASPNATHAEKRLGIPVKTCVLEHYTRNSFTLPMDSGMHRNVMRACADVAAMFVLNPHDNAFAIVGADQHTRDDHMGVVLLREEAIIQAFGVKTLREWEKQWPSNILLDEAQKAVRSGPANRIERY